MVNNQTNSQTFTLIAERVREFTIKLINFPTSVTLILLLSISSISISALPKFNVRGILSQRVSKVSMLLLNKLSKRGIINNNLHKLTFLYLPKIMYKIIIDVTSKINVAPTPRINHKGILSLSARTIEMTLNVIAAILRRLSEFDPQTLATLDSLILAQMDHN